MGERSTARTICGMCPVEVKIKMHIERGILLVALLKPRGETHGNTGESMINRESAWCLLTEFTQSESLRKHALAVEACMRACARKYGDDPRRGIFGASSA